MSRLQYQNVYTFFGGALYILLALIACVPIWLVIDNYVNSVNVHLDEAVATGATITCMVGIFTGRFLVKTVMTEMAVMPVRLMALLAIVIFACICWLFIFPMASIPVPNPFRLLLYWVPFITICLATGALIKITSTTNRNRLRTARITAETSKAELQMLQSKLSPHFLFNTLNNLYGISITRHEKIPALLLKLSDLLRYSVYDVNETYVPLKDDIAYLSNYIDFEKIRIGDRLVLTIDLPETIDPAIKIAPMLFVVFIENAFKHAKNTSDRKIYIDIRIRASETAIDFSIKNSHSMTEEKTGMSNKHSGFGLASARRRLELLYTGRHMLTIKNEATTYEVNLQLTLK